MSTFRLFFVNLTVAVLLSGCTIDVGQPNIEIGCVEVDFPNEHVLYCDGGEVQQPPKDAGPRG